MAIPQRFSLVTLGVSDVEHATAAPGVLEAIAGADVVLLAPSNPVVSIGTILGIPGIRDAVATTAAPVVGVAGIIGGAVVRGMADACLAAIGVETDAAAVARLALLLEGHRGAGGAAVVTTHQPLALPDAIEVAL